MRCKQHKKKCIERLIDSKDKDYLLGSGYFNKPDYLYTNTIINTHAIGDENLENVIETHMFNTKTYGPQKESYYKNKEWLNNIY